jgi:hypothetical protein
MFALNTPLIRRLVRLGYDINSGDSSGCTAVQRVLWLPVDERRKFDVLRTLCEEGADVNFAPCGDAEILRKLIANYSSKVDTTLLSV